MDKQKTALGIILLLVFSMLTGCGYKDYDSCIIGEMKGQDRAVFSTVKRVCESQFPFEKNLRSRRDIRISWNHNSTDHNLIDFYASVGSLPYSITRAKVSLHTEGCDFLGYAKESKTIWVVFNKNKSNIRIDNARHYNCLKTLDIYGIHQSATQLPSPSVSPKISFGWMPLIFLYGVEVSVTTIFLFTIVWFFMRKRGNVKLKHSYLWFVGGFLITTISVGLVSFIAAYTGFKAALTSHVDEKWLFFVIAPIVVSVLVCSFVRSRYIKLANK